MLKIWPGIREAQLFVTQRISEGDRMHNVWWQQTMEATSTVGKQLEEMVEKRNAMQKQMESFEKEKALLQKMKELFEREKAETRKRFESYEQERKEMEQYEDKVIGLREAFDEEIKQKQEYFLLKETALEMRERALAEREAAAGVSIGASIDLDSSPVPKRARTAEGCEDGWGTGT